MFSILKIDLTTTADKFLRVEKQAIRIDANFSHLTIWSIVTVVILLEEEKRNLHLGMIRELVGKTGIKRGIDVIRIAKSLVWVGKLTDDGAERLAAEITGTLV